MTTDAGTLVEARLAQAIESGEMPKELLVCGPAGTGKTFAILKVIHCLCRDEPNLRVLFIRATRASLTESVLVTYEQEILPADGCEHISAGQQRSHRHSYKYDNGSEIVLVGLDRNPLKALSTTWDIVYANEAIEVAEDSWETISSRLDRPGRDTRFGWLIADTNPSFPGHWLKRRCDQGKTELWTTTHEANPSLHDGEGWTEAGHRYLTKLDTLTGTRYLRLRKGIWAAAEGLVYQEWDRGFHLIGRFEIPDSWTRYRVIDFGYTNPFVCQWWAEDGDGRLFRYREIYMTGRTVAKHADAIRELSAGERYAATISDHDAEDRATLHDAGIHTVAAIKAVKPGIEAVQERLDRAGDGRARIYLLKDSLVERDERLSDAKKPTCTEDEFASYVWSPESATRAAKEEPVKLHDHGMDAMRYMVSHLAGGPAVSIGVNPFSGYRG